MAIPKRPSAAFPAATIERPASVTAQTVDSWDNLKPRGHFIGLYGVGGAGKTTLAAMLPGKTLFIDLEGSLKVIRGKLEELGLIGNITPKFIRFDPAAPATAWEDLIAFLKSDAVKGYDNVVIDSFTRAQEFAASNCIASIPPDSATIKQSLEQWTYGKGGQIVYDKFVPIYPLIDDLLEAGCNVCAICHDNVLRIANPEGGDFIHTCGIRRNPYFLASRLRSVFGAAHSFIRFRFKKKTRADGSDYRRPSRILVHRKRGNARPARLIRSRRGVLMPALETRDRNRNFSRQAPFVEFHGYLFRLAYVDAMRDNRAGVPVSVHPIQSICEYTRQTYRL